ncbi:hypothetical protein NQ117_04405 [Paenibacillus sp. SC116]|uniref:DUF7507 domain-containing protein n=1 Tax=Paenibacillus sp. SC116 TaxID=2968986 RepID=UPI00215A92D1|nr:hypothetical protein [Paenibacillus sp. SC116]MCR8842912.1 hypothetical protein [Paenibacillus sp. SC116]
MSNQVAVPVYDSVVSLVKLADVSDAIAGEGIQFTIILTNNSTRTIRQAVLTNILAEYCRFIPGTVIIQGVEQPLATPYAIVLAAINPGEKIVIQYSVLITYVPQRETTSTQADLSYQASGEQELISSNMIYLELFPSAVQLSKQAEVSAVMVGSWFTYQINAAHNGPLSGDLLIFDKLPTEVEYIPGSLIVNGERRLGESPETGISWNPFTMGQIVKVRFDVRVIAKPSSGRLLNEVGALFTIDLPSGRKAVSTYTAQAELIIVSEPLIVRKSASASIIQVGSEVGYTITVTNILAHALYNLFVIDLLPSGLQWIPGSVTINGLPDPNRYDLSAGIRIGSLEAGSTITVVFKAKLISYQVNRTLANQASVRYVAEQIQGTVSSNIVTITAEPGPPIPPPPPIDPDRKKKLSIYLDPHSIPQHVFVGDVLSLQYVIENISDDDLFNVLVKLNMNSSGAFIVGSLTVNGIVLDGNPFTGFVIQQLKKGERIIVRFQIRIIPLSDGSNLVIGGDISYDYRWVDEAIISGQVAIIPASIQLYDPSLVVAKSASTKSATVGDSISYTLTIQNTGNRTLSLNVTDQLPSNLMLVPDTLTVDGAAWEGSFLTKGITILNVEPNKTIRVKYKSKVTHYIDRAISNTALVIAKVVVATESREFSYYSNTVEIKLLEDEE